VPPNPTRGEALAVSSVESSVAAALVAILGVTAYRWGLFAGRSISLGAGTRLVGLAYYATAPGSALAVDYFSRRSLPAPAVTGDAVSAANVPDASPPTAN
jgi:hypothetical protein